MSPLDHLDVTSVHYPAQFPTSVQQELTFTTELGYNIVLNLIAAEVYLSTNVSGMVSCANTCVEVIDMSLSKEGSSKKMYTCETLDDIDEVNGVFMASVTSFLNTLKVVVSSGNYGDGYFGLSLFGNVTAVEGKLIVERPGLQNIHFLF